MYIQKVNWGSIEWINLDKIQKKDVGMNIGIVTLNPKTNMPAHTHYDSQVLFFLEALFYT